MNRNTNSLVSLKRFLSVFLLLSLMLAAQPAFATLEVFATNAANPVRPSELLAIEFTITNTNAFARSDVVMTMTYPADLLQLFESSFDGDCPATSCSNGETVTWTIGTIPAGGSITLPMAPTVTANATAGTTISFAPSVTDSLLDVDTTTLNVTVNPVSLYDIVLSENSDPATANSQLTYRTQFGLLDDAASVVDSNLVFTLPAGSTFVSATDGGVFNASEVSWPLGFLNPGEGGSREVTVTLGAGLNAGDIVSATAQISSVSTPTDNAVSVTNTTIAASNPLKISIVNDLNPIRPSEIGNKIVTVTNTDAFSRFGVVITANYPEGINQLFESNFDGDCASSSCTQGERVTWTIGTIPAGQTRTFMYSPFYLGTATGGSLVSFNYIVSDSTGLQSRRTGSVRVQSDALYDIILSESKDPVQAGANLSYLINFDYRDDAAAVNNSKLQFPVPSGTTFVSATGGGVLSSGIVEWDLGFLSPGQGGVREVIVSVDAGLVSGAFIEAGARVIATALPIQTGYAEADTMISGSTGLQFSIEANASPVRVSELTNWQLIVRNTDNFTHFGVDITSYYPQTLAQLFETEFEGDCASTTCTAGERLTWAVGDIAAGESKAVVLPGVPAPTALGNSIVPLHAMAEDDQGVQSRYTESIRVQADTIYKLNVAESSDPAIAGAQLSYTLTFGHLEDSGATNNSMLQFPIPAGTSFVSASDGGALNSGVVEWSLGFLAPGASGQRTVTVQLDGGLVVGGNIEAAGKVFSIATPINSTRAEASTIVATAKGLQIGFQANANPARPSELVDYRTTVSNFDPFTRFNVELTTQYPQQLNQLFELYFAGQCSSTTCTSGELLTWSLGDIPAGETRSVNLPPLVSGAVPNGSLINLFAVARDDQGLQGKRAQALRVQDDTIYDLAITVSDNPATAGSTIGYQLTYGYRADAGQVNDSKIVLPVPTGASFISATAGGVLIGNNVEWNLGFLSPGDGGIVNAVFQLDGALAAGTQVEANAELLSISSPVERAHGQVTTIVRATTSLSLTMNPITITSEQSRELNIELTVTNHDAFSRFGVSLQGIYPQNLLQLFESDPDFTGDCASTTCTAGELIQWPLVDLAAGESFTVTFAPTVGTTVVDGQLINFSAWVTDDQNVQAGASQGLYTGCISALDGDCDGIPNTTDNCSILANTGQYDSNGDGFGNICDPDLDNNGFVNFLDVGLFATVIFTNDADADFDGNGSVNFLDFNTVVNFIFLPPGPGATVD